MSSKEEQASDEEVCASCGKAAVDNVKLKACTACKLVKYCSVGCQKNHRPQHKKACRKRVAELRDDRLFSQPDESYLGECPICCLPLSLDLSKSRLNSCCCQLNCIGCSYANKKREFEQGLEHKCAYCREPVRKSEEDEQHAKNFMKRVKVNDPVALCEMAKKHYEEGDYECAVEHFTKAAELGNIEAHYSLSISYWVGEGVEKDKKKTFYHLEEAAIGGHPDARFNLGIHERIAGRFDRAVKHFLIGAKLGCDGALDKVKEDFHIGLVSKEDYEAALRGHQAAVNATKSQQREEAEKAKREGSCHTTLP
jgi:tetratricopeptide (TPR) repeat protein